MNKTYYICKYTPTELLKAFGADCAMFNSMPDGFTLAEQLAHPNICGFGKALLEGVLSGEVKELVLVNCCDTIRSVYDVLKDQGNMDFLYLLDMLHTDGNCSRSRTAFELKKLAKAYGAYKGTSFHEEKFLQAFSVPEKKNEPYLAVLGARMGTELFAMVQEAMPYPVQNDTCVHNRCVGEVLPEENLQFDELMEWYAGELLRQMPCMRMVDRTGRKQLYNDPNLKGIIYHTVKFCDFYSFEYAQIKEQAALPILKIESDYTIQSSGQLSTRLEAFAESLDLPGKTARAGRGSAQKYGNTADSGSDFGTMSGTDFRTILRTDSEKDSGTGFEANFGTISGTNFEKYSGTGSAADFGTISGTDYEKYSGTSSEENLRMSEKGAAKNHGENKENSMGMRYYAGIDSGSTSTDVVILDQNRKMAAGVILPTGAGAAAGAERALEEALRQAGLSRNEIDTMVTTGYGRAAISVGDKSITEITCHAKGAHYLAPEVRTVVDIGGQDSKVIALDEEGNVVNFVMNDKCAAGTGRFLEMMARTLEMPLDDLSTHGLNYKEDITISSMCTVFAESEIVSLIAQNKATDDIVHGLNKAVAVKTAALVKRVGKKERVMMTGGVSKNKGLVQTLEEKLETKLLISEHAQLCGALGAALFAAEM